MKKINSNDITIQLIEFLSGLNEKQWSIKITKDWNTHDVVAHLVGWLEECIKEFPKAWENKTDPWFISQNYSAFNENNVLKYRNYSHKSLIEKYKQVNDQFNALIESVGEEAIRNDKRFSWVLDEGDDNHELHHFNQIKEILKFV
jgi:hypothetical protein